MKSVKLFIKNMVCNRCILVVGQELAKLHIEPVSITLGEIILAKPPSPQVLVHLRDRLTILGFEALDDAKTKLIEVIKTIVIEEVHHSLLKEGNNFSTILKNKLNKDYSYLSGLFSEVEGITIEKYIIKQKIEKVKELLVYYELNLSEIAFQLGYSSVAHLSNQFKKVTGLTPSHFKKIVGFRRKPIDEV
jgi:AraC family transcriptional regulator